MWNTLFAIVFYTAGGLAIITALIWYGRSLYDVITGRGEIVIAEFDIVGAPGDKDKTSGMALAHMLQARLREIGNDLDAGQEQLTQTVAKESKVNAFQPGVVPPLWNEKKVGLETGLFEPANINVSVAGVAVGGVIEWIQRALVTTRTLKFTIYHKKGVAQVSGSLKPLSIVPDALRLEIKADSVDLDLIVDSLALEIIRRRLSQDSSNFIQTLDLDEFRSLVDTVKSAASYNRSVALGRPMVEQYKDLLGKVKPLANKVPKWYQLNYLAAGIAESAESSPEAAEFYTRVAKALDGDPKQTKLLESVRARANTLTGIDFGATEERIRADAQYAVVYFNKLLNLDLKMPPMRPVPRDLKNSFWDGTTYNFSPEIQSIPDITYHEISFPFLSAICSQYNEGTWERSQSESAAILYAYSDILAMMAKQHRLDQTAESASWLFAEGAVAWVLGLDPTRDLRPLRSFKTPGTAYNDPTLGKDPQVAHMRDFVREEIHFQRNYYVNSGIFNKAFYEAAIRVGTEQAGKIWIAALRDVQDAKALDAKKFADLLESAAGQDKDKIRDALAVVGIQTGATLLGQNPAPSASPSPTPAATASVSANR